MYIYSKLINRIARQSLYSREYWNMGRNLNKAITKNKQISSQHYGNTWCLLFTTQEVKISPYSLAQEKQFLIQWFLLSGLWTSKEPGILQGDLVPIHTQVLEEKIQKYRITHKEHWHCFSPILYTYYYFSNMCSILLKLIVS